MSVYCRRLGRCDTLLCLVYSQRCPLSACMRLPYVSHACGIEKPFCAWVNGEVDLALMVSTVLRLLGTYYLPHLSAYIDISPDCGDRMQVFTRYMHTVRCLQLPLYLLICQLPFATQQQRALLIIQGTVYPQSTASQRSAVACRSASRRPSFMPISALVVLTDVDSYTTRL